MTEQYPRYSGTHYRTAAGFHGSLDLECLICPWAHRVIHTWVEGENPNLAEQQGRAMDHHGRTHSRPAT